jgi:hypothetical protein
MPHDGRQRIEFGGDQELFQGLIGMSSDIVYLVGCRLIHTNTHYINTHYM